MGIGNCLVQYKFWVVYSSSFPISLLRLIHYTKIKKFPKTELFPSSGFDSNGEVTCTVSKMRTQHLCNTLGLACAPTDPPEWNSIGSIDSHAFSKSQKLALWWGSPPTPSQHFCCLGRPSPSLPQGRLVFPSAKLFGVLDQSQLGFPSSSTLQDSTL